MTDWVVELMEKLGAPGAGLAIALENLFPPIPSEVILPLAGFTVAQGDMNLIAVLVWTTLGSVVGAVALYWVGVLLGRDRILAIAAKMPLVKVEDILKTEAWFFKHGRKTVFFGRMIPIFRSLISIPAGVTKMPLGIFLLLTTTGSLIWNTIFVLAGYALGENWELVETYVGASSKVVAGVVVVAVLVYLGVKVNDRRKGKDQAGEGPEGAEGLPGQAQGLPGQPGQPGQGHQAGQGQPGQGHPGQAYQGRHGQGYQDEGSRPQGGQPYQGQPGQPYQGQGGRPQGGQGYPGQVPGQAPGQAPSQGRPSQGHPGQAYQGRHGQGYQGQGGQGGQGWNTPQN